MKRLLTKALETWKDSPIRLPLIIRGARQVGKSWLVRSFGNNFTRFVEINFEEQKDAHQLFTDNLDIDTLIKKLSIYTNIPIIPGETLLFFDEIQECERAIVSLRYFKEKLPQLHVIAAGSLVDFAIEKIGVPVGRVQFLYLYPLSFYEFLLAQQRENLLAYIEEGDIAAPIHQQLLEQVQHYFILGGMPAVISTWLAQQDILLCQTVQDNIVQAYQQDFEKYARTKQIDSVEKTFNAIPLHLGEKFKYQKIDPEMRSYSIKSALQLLHKAGIVYYCYQTPAQNLPLKATQNESHFKTFFFDIGLAQRVMGLSAKDWLMGSINAQIKGGIAEQFVAQEYIAYSPSHKPAELHYWHREARSSNAEVDFIFVNEGIIPVEVKANKKGGLHSLLYFLENHNSTRGLKISSESFSVHNNIESIPFYALHSWLNKRH